LQDFSRPVPLAHYALLVVAVLGCFFLGIGGFPLFDLDEGAFSEATREMLASGNFLSTTLNGEPRYDKPILIYWLQAASVRLPPALCPCR
jgi:4-amino-4-deoxy-L-arabinose transferase-like glycosyltransferase